MKIAKKCARMTSKMGLQSDYFAVRALLGCNGALVTFQRRARCMTKACPLRVNKALTAERKACFGAEKATFLH